MKLRSRKGGGDAFDGLTAEDVRRIRGGAAASVTPGLEGLAEDSHAEHFIRNHVTIVGERTLTGADLLPPKRKRGRRA